MSGFTTTPNYNLRKPTVGGDNDLWGGDWNINADLIDAAIKARADAIAGFGSMAQQNAPAVAITGGQVSGLTQLGVVTTAFAASDPRIPNLGLGVQDAAGNIAGAVMDDGSLQWGLIAATTMKASTASANTLTPIVLNLQENQVAALDTRVPDIMLSWQDAAGNIGGAIDRAGVLMWSVLRASVVTSPAVTTTTLTIGADRFSELDPRVPDFVYVWQDASGNIVAGLDRNGVFNAALGNTGMVPISGASMTGPLILAADPSPSVPNGAATKNYVDTKALLLTGGALLGPVSVAAAPTTAAQIASKGYVDQAVLNAGGSGPGLDPTFNSVNVPDHYLIGGKMAIRMWTPNPGSTGVDGLPNTHVGQYITSVGNGNVLVGCYAGGPNMTSGENTYVGMQAGASHTGPGQQNLAMGCGALRVDPSPANVVAVGSDVCRNSTNNLRSVFVGTHAGRNGNGITDSILIGHWVMFGTDGVMPPLVNTVAIGSYVLSDPNMGSANNSVFVGANVVRKGQSVPGNLVLGPNVASGTLVNGTGLIYLGASNAIDAAAPTENNTFRLGNHPTNLMRATAINTASPQFFFDWLPGSPSYANDAAAAAGGVEPGQIYRSGSAVMCRVA